MSALRVLSPYEFDKPGVLRCILPLQESRPDVLDLDPDAPNARLMEAEMTRIDKSSRYFALLLAGLLLAATGPAEARYSKSPFAPNGFPKPVINTVFSIPLDPAQLVVVYPAALEPAAKKLQAALAARCGREIPFAPADTLKPEDLAGRHLIVIGNILNNRWALELYKQRRAFADAVFPGKGGYIIHPATSVWDRTRNALVIGTSSADDLAPAFEAFVSLIPQGTDKIDALHALKTSLEMPAPPANAAKMLDEARKNTTTAGGPYGAVGTWGLNYFISGDKAWAELFREGFAVFYDRAKKSGDWVPEAWTNIYFSLRGLFQAWDLIDDDPFFTEADRKMIEETLWGFTTFVRNMILLDKDIAPAGEPRQNHTSHMAFGLFYAHNYYTEKYGMSGLEPMADQFKLAFDSRTGQRLPPQRRRRRLSVRDARRLLHLRFCPGRRIGPRSGPPQAIPGPPVRDDRQPRRYGELRRHRRLLAPREGRRPEPRAAFRPAGGLVLQGRPVPVARRLAGEPGLSGEPGERRLRRGHQARAALTVRGHHERHPGRGLALVRLAARGTAVLVSPAR